MFLVPEAMLVLLCPVLAKCRQIPPHYTAPSVAALTILTPCVPPKHMDKGEYSILIEWLQLVEEVIPEEVIPDKEMVITMRV